MILSIQNNSKRKDSRILNLLKNEKKGKSFQKLSQAFYLGKLVGILDMNT